MANVFISYAREDGRAFAERLHAQLQNSDKVWFDERSLAPGVDWDDEIASGIERCDVVLVVVTRAYARSSFARKEVVYASGKRKPILPLLFEPKADVGIHLVLTEWIDFTAGDQWAELRKQIDISAKGGSVAAQDVRARNWDLIHARMAARARSAVRDLFAAHLYVRRDAEKELAAFFASTEPALLVIGESGVGKTSLLCQSALDLTEQGQAVLFYDCSALTDADVEEEIARDSGLPKETALEELQNAAAGAGRHFVFIFESIGDYGGAEENGTQLLLRSIDRLASRVDAKYVRVIASCNTAVWNRLRRGAPRSVAGSNYFAVGDDHFLRLELFTEAERDAAYRVYREAFSLETELDALPSVVGERLRDPALLRLVAEVYKGRREPLLPVNLGTRLYQAFFEERVTPPAEELLVDDIAGKMLEAKTATLSMRHLDSRLQEAVADPRPQSPYARLVARGVLQEVPDRLVGFNVRFSHTRVAAYAIATYCLRRSKDAARVAEELLIGVEQFPVAWDAAKMLLLLSGDEAQLAAIGASASAEARELSMQVLVELHAEKPREASNVLQQLLAGSSDQGRRTALKAAFNIGPDARELFMQAAIDGAPWMRDSVKYMLYLIWRNESPGERRSIADTFYLIWRRAPGFTYQFVEMLVSKVSYLHPAALKPTLEFIFDVVITIYINHCDDPTVIDKTASIMEDVTVNRLHLKTLTRVDTINKLFVHAMTAVFGQQILEWMMFGKVEQAQDFFRLPAEQRACLSRIAEAFDPAFELHTAYDDLASMLRAEMPIFNGSAAMAIAVHAVHDLAATEPLVRRLWEAGGAKERLWILVAFSVLLKSTPDDWVPLLEDLTRRYVTEQRDAFLGAESRIPGDLDIVFVPLGLAYGKRDMPMKLFEEALGEALREGNHVLVARIITALAAVGFYFPYALFDVLRPAFAQIEQVDIADAMVTTLATVRTLHFDAVDHFLDGTEASDALRHRIDAAADVTLLHRYIRVLGYYNNAVHFSLRYPRMRKALSAGSLKLLATAATPVAFIADYTLTALRMMREANFQLKKWTLPE